jgi:hypothetical protein
MNHPCVWIIRVQRYFCGPCKGTHSILPKNLLPICRWFLGDILVIIKRFDQGESAYAIARSIGESLASLLHLKTWLKTAAATVERLARESGLLDTLPPRPISNDGGNRLKLTSLWPTWSEFAYSFSRSFYPKRFPFFKPHIILTG